MMTAPIAYEPISLGSVCEAKFQICRKLYRTFYGRTSEPGFRVQMMPPERGQRYYDWHAFDWQRTPFANVLDWLERDFNGVLEREDMAADGNFVMHRSGTEHSHQFHGFTADWTEGDLDRAYPSVRRHFDRRIIEFREMLTKPGPYLYIWTASYYVGTDFAPSTDQAKRLLSLLGSGSPEHRFKLLIVSNPGKGVDYSGVDERITQAFRTDESNKSSAMRWEGNDAVWDEILAPFDFTLHDRPAPGASTSPAAPEPAAARKGFLARLIERP